MFEELETFYWVNYKSTGRGSKNYAMRRFPVKNQVPKETITLIKKLYREGKSVKIISKMFNRNKSVIYNCIHRGI